MVHIFLINPVAGNRNFSPILREEIAKIKGIRYYIFNIRYEGYETELMRELEALFDEEDRIRVYSCGGSGTFKRILDGITDFNKVELAFYPAGMSNDFLKTFGEDAKKFKNVQNLVDGTAIKVDYIQSDIGRALNFFSTGLDATIVERIASGHQLFPNATRLTYLYGIFTGIAFARPKVYSLNIDDEAYVGTLAEVALANGCVIGGVLKMAESADIQNGKAHLTMVRKVSGLGLLPYFRAFVKGDKHFRVLKCVNRDIKTMTIRNGDNSGLTINMDGEIFTAANECKAWIVPRGLQFVVPKGVIMP